MLIVDTHDETPGGVAAVAEANHSPVALSEAGGKTWRLVLHALRASHCVTYVKVRDGRWIAVEAYGPSYSTEHAAIRLMVRRLTPDPTEAISALSRLMEGREYAGIASDLLTVRLPHCRCMSGFLQVGGQWAGDPFSDFDRITLQLLGHHVLSLLRDVFADGDTDYSVANVDYLTGLFNYRYFRQRLVREVLQAELSGEPLSLLMVDLVHYKLVNDTYGHEVGNVVLAQIASLLKSAVREADIVCRYGGDEFVVMLPRTARQQAVAAAHRLEGRMRASRIDVQDIGPVTTPNLTIGISTFPYPGTTAEELIRQADDAQYQAKALSPPAICSFRNGASPAFP